MCNIFCTTVLCLRIFWKRVGFSVPGLISCMFIVSFSDQARFIRKRQWVASVRNIVYYRICMPSHRLFVFAGNIYIQKHCVNLG